ncbi:MAG: S-methyl-5-thioribose-1-phosphate isomerase [Candidatus Methanoperedens sp.]|nr:S-methyl-5-thioribose-1-phosphate isomerase [Candidatus Methanoperedens sp.]
MRTIDWDYEKNNIIMIDQTLLPAEYRIIECSTIDSLCEAIIFLRVRGAPALGAAGGFGVALSAFRSNASSLDALIKNIENAGKTLIATRPTAVNLSWGVKRVIRAVEDARNIKEARMFALDEAKAIADEDVKKNMQLGEYGASLLEDGDTVMTHCNAGRLACVDWGTALGVIRSARAEGKDIKVISSVFNKIGTYTHSIVAKEHGIPFYVAAPVSTFDFERLEDEVEIEIRKPQELRFFADKQIAPLEVDVYNPAFDATPMENVTGIITENGIFSPPFLIDEVKIKI